MTPWPTLMLASTAPYKNVGNWISYQLNVCFAEKLFGKLFLSFSKDHAPPRLHYCESYSNSGSSTNLTSNSSMSKSNFKFPCAICPEKSFIEFRCKMCRRNYCVKHRHQLDHVCKTSRQTRQTKKDPKCTIQ